ncbi:MAG: aminoacyl-tRNA hydrolase [Deltaproteobacteria bacterium RBG_13_43_22]|nr:MAG: aminoacyl-tRNA hydrolase [Deltaproteobacteria bacterium RBG_13_43_22]
MYLISGLGNPGQNYLNTRHNLGFLTLKALARRHNISTEKRKFESRYGLGEILREKVILLTPLTYMNRSGLAVGSFLRYFRIPPDCLIVIHDDLDLPWTRIRIAEGGGAAGHKGILSIIDQLQTRDFYRIRMGIGHPQEKIPPESYVLEPFSAEERKELQPLTTQACEAIEVIIEQGISAAMNRFNVRKSKTEI